VRGIDHALGYAALAAGSIDLKDAYSTDAKIEENNLIVLDDDLHFFPQYQAVFLYRLDMDNRAVAALENLTGTIDEARMRHLNSEAERTKDYTYAAGLYFGQKYVSPSNNLVEKIGRLTLRHLELVGASLFLGIIAGIPLGIRASRPGPVSNFILSTTSVIQTIPSLALLALLVPLPFFGISSVTAIFALFLYSLLPIVRNTAAGLQEIPTAVRESAAALGLEPQAQLWKVFLPLASRTILAGVKTSAIIDVGTATLAALIGVGGLGEPIISGLNLNDTGTILQGAIPAALLALLVQFFFDGLDRVFVPKGLRLKQ
jgi:osmoprotectant transport system permease protein